MPEGDTIHKIAAYMAPVLTGAAIDAVTIGTRRCAEFEGRTVHAVEARGKHLWIGVGKGVGIRSHLGMHGSWHVYAPDETWQRPRRQASLVVDASGRRWVCFNAREVEIVDTPGVRDNILRSTLGPDLIADDPDPALLIRRAREFDDGDSLLIDTLLNQRVAAGIGNVYKSEVMFLHRIPPTQPTASTSDAVIAACYHSAAALLRDNLGGGRRVTRKASDNAGRLWVYGRTGKPCHVCDTPIRTQRMGRHHRGTYWCPSCQAPDVTQHAVDRLGEDRT